MENWRRGVTTRTTAVGLGCVGRRAAKACTSSPGLGRQAVSGLLSFCSPAPMLVLLGVLCRPVLDRSASASLLGDCCLANTLIMVQLGRYK